MKNRSVNKKVSDICDLETEIIDLADKHIKPYGQVGANQIPCSSSMA